MSTLGKLFKRIKKVFIQEVPSDMYACETCDETSCLENDWKNCQYRLRSQKFIEVKKRPQEPSQPSD